MSKRGTKSNLHENLPPVHLIIQGPIISWSPKSQTNSNYDSTENIILLLQNYALQFKSIHIVTWNDQPTNGLAELINEAKFHNVYLKKINDPGIGSDIFGALPDNRLRQYFSTRAGIDFANSHAHSGDLCIKVRTDQFIDLSLLVKELRAIISADHNKIVFPFALPRDLYSVGDFYIGGKIDVMLQFLDYLTENTVFIGSRSIHADIAMKYIRCRNKNRNFRFIISGKDANRCGLVSIEKNEVSQWVDELEKYFGLFSRRLFRTATWRAQDFGSRNGYLFNEDLRKGKDHILEILILNSARRVVDSSFFSRMIFSDIDENLSGSFSIKIFKLKYFIKKKFLSV